MSFHTTRVGHASQEANIHYILHPQEERRVARVYVYDVARCLSAGSSFRTCLRCGVDGHRAALPRRFYLGGEGSELNAPFRDAGAHFIHIYRSCTCRHDVTHIRAVTCQAVSGIYLIFAL